MQAVFCQVVFRVSQRPGCYLFAVAVQRWNKQMIYQSLCPFPPPPSIWKKMNRKWPLRETPWSLLNSSGIASLLCVSS